MFVLLLCVCYLFTIFCGLTGDYVDLMALLDYGICCFILVCLCWLLLLLGLLTFIRFINLLGLVWFVCYCWLVCGVRSLVCLLFGVFWFGCCDYVYGCGLIVCYALLVDYFIVYCMVFYGVYGLVLWTRFACLCWLHWLVTGYFTAVSCYSLFGFC